MSSKKEESILKLENGLKLVTSFDPKKNFLYVSSDENGSYFSGDRIFTLDSLISEVKRIMKERTDSWEKFQLYVDGHQIQFWKFNKLCKNKNLNFKQVMINNHEGNFISGKGCFDFQMVWFRFDTIFDIPLYKF